MYNELKLWSPCRYASSLYGMTSCGSLESDMIRCMMGHITNMLCDAKNDLQAGELLNNCWSTSKEIWKVFPEIAGSIINPNNFDARDFARTLHHFYPDEVGRKWIRACIYLHADFNFLNKERPLQLDAEFYAKHYMLLLSTLAISRNVELSGEVADIPGLLLWRHWVDYVVRLAREGADGSATEVEEGSVLDNLIEDAWLKASADEAQLEDDGRILRIRAEPVIWRADRSESGWNAFCEDLALNAFGDTYADLQDCISEVTHHWLMALIEEDKFDAESRKRSWEAESSPMELELAGLRFDLPFTCIIRGDHQSDKI